MDQKFIIKLQGKEHVLYAGLLDEATRRGLVSLSVTLVQAPSEANKSTAICEARAVFADGNGVERSFTDIGDASPANCSKGVAAHYIRMSATRAKARALRDGLNIGGAAFEELDAEMPAGTSQPTAVSSSEPATPAEPMASDDQKTKIAEQMRRIGMSAEDGKEYLTRNFQKVSRSQLTAAEASAFIAYLVSRPAASQAA